ncbi:NUDIX hydrolase [Corynebacterium ulcerans]|uniref:NUDIX hydrolase n=1 Tax=Corynebacterium ulcerans TaxID=65058 RepID=UPI0018D71878|nr:CoA pyrophosphatase [Corynebacterium ulcerans]MBH5295179.1 CoA pyrophosphatase [Corynebacterium ulcerans]
MDINEGRLGDFPRPDIPGENITLRPERAPVWMRRLVGDVTGGAIDGRIRRALRPESSPDSTKRAAVLVLLAGAETSAEMPNDASVLLMHRSPSMRAHSGQIAFPGGRLDKTDANAVDCALREAWEETGLDRRTVTPLAQLPEVHIRATGYPVLPVLAHWHSIGPIGVVSPQEADSVANIPVLSLTDPANRFMVQHKDWSGPAFRVNDYVIWGFTGGLLDALITHAGWEHPWDKTTHYDLHKTLSESRNNERLGQLYPRR